MNYASQYSIILQYVSVCYVSMHLLLLTLQPIPRAHLHQADAPGQVFKALWY